MFQILKKCSNRQILTLLTPKINYGFSADHHDDHHEIDRTKIKFRDQKSGYYLNPNEVARRMVRVIAQHDKVQNPQKLTLNSQWHELGLNELDTVELLLGIEDEFKIEFPDDVSEKFKDVHDVVQYVSRSFWAQ